MNNINSDSSGAGGTSMTAERNRQSWTPKEEPTLIAALKELIVKGQKSDNRFRAGYICKQEEALQKEFPRTDLKAMPHINSKLSSTIN